MKQEEALDKLTEEERQLFGTMNPDDVVKRLACYGNLMNSIDARLGQGNPITQYFLDRISFNMFRYRTGQLNHEAQRAVRTLLDTSFFSRTNIPETVRKAFEHSVDKLHEDANEASLEIARLTKVDNKLRYAINVRERTLENYAKTMRPTDAELRKASLHRYYQNLIKTDFDKVSFEDPVFRRIQNIRNALQVKDKLETVRDGTNVLYDIYDMLDELQNSFYNRTMSGETYEGLMRGKHPMYDHLRDLHSSIEFNAIDENYRKNDLGK
jgi:hypothetical protein